MRTGLTILIIASLLLQVSCKGKTAVAETSLQRVECRELGIYFMVPTSFKYLNEEKMNELTQRGDNAFKEESLENKELGWQSPCPGLQDSLKRSIFIAAITEKEAIESDGSADAFIQKTFTDYNRFIGLRIERKAGTGFDRDKTVKQKDIAIAGYNVKANYFNWVENGILLFRSSSYFFRHSDRLFMITFTGSPKISDNEAIEQAIEKAERLDAKNTK
jgi:hypothetical protein